MPPRIAPRFGYRQKALARSQYIGGSLNNPHQPIERANRLVYEGVRNIGSTGQLWTHRSNSLILNLCEQLNMSTGKIRLQHYYKCRQATYKEYQHECATNLNSTVGITTRESGTGLYSKCITTMYVKLPTRSTKSNVQAISSSQISQRREPNKSTAIIVETKYGRLIQTNV